MRKLTKIQSVLMWIGALSLVAGVFMTVIGIGDVWGEGLRAVAAVLFAVGAVLFASMQMMQTYDGNNVTICRLRRILIMGNVCLVFSGLLLIEQTFRIVFPLFGTSIEGYNSYCHYVQNNWGVLLLIFCVIELYATLRLSSELK